jgi:serine/threonine protein kinase
LLTTFQQRTQAAGGYYNQKEVVAGGRSGTGVHVFMVFELMQQTLLDVLQQAPGGKLERETVRLIVYQMIKALDHMHTLNVRDLKSTDRLFTETSNRKTCSFRKYLVALALRKGEALLTTELQ